MAKKSRTSKSKSNDSQKKLLALVLIILFVGLGVFLVVSSFAAKGGKGKPGSGVTLVDSPYAIKADPNPVKYRGTIYVSVFDKSTGSVLTSLPEEMLISGACYYNGNNVSSIYQTLYSSVTGVDMLNQALANGANCNVDLSLRRNFQWVPTSTVSFTVIP